MITNRRARIVSRLRHEYTWVEQSTLTGPDRLIKGRRITPNTPYTRKPRRE